MKVNSGFLVINDYQRVSGSRSYKASIQEQIFFNIGQALPAIVPGRGCIGIAVPYEFHVNQYGTIVFFTLMDKNLVSSKMTDTLYKVWSIQNNGAIGYSSDRPVAATRQDSDTRRSGMDAAARMMAGIERDPDDIASGRQMPRGDDSEHSSIWDMMREANPGDSFFDD